MGILDKLLGRDDEPERERPAHEQKGAGTGPANALTDEQAIARYRYMLRTAPPEMVEQAHEEAFAQLTPEQRRMALDELSAVVPAYERTAGGQSPDDPRALARMATRAELRQPGTLERVFGNLGGYGAGQMGLGGMLAGSFLTSLAGSFIGSAIAQQFFDNDTGYGDSFARDESGHEAGDTGSTDQASSDTNDTAFDTGDSAEGGFDDIGGDLGGDFGGEF